MTPFQKTLYYLNNQRKVGTIEKSFVDIKDQLDLYEKQYLNSIDLYLKNRQEEIKIIEKKYLKLTTDAQLIYNETIETGGLDDDIAINYAQHISGLDYLFDAKNEEIEEIKEKHSNFLDILSKSTLIALYSLNENFLNEMCNNAAQIFDKKIKVSHFNSRDYLISSFHYLDLVLEIPQKNFESYISKLTEIKLLRNKIIHAGSKITEEKALKLVKKYPDSFLINSANQFVKVISSKFIKEFFNLLNNFYHELLWLLEEKQNYINLISILENWFGLIDQQIKVSEISSRKVSKNIRAIDFKIESDNKKIVNFTCKLTLSKSKRNTNVIFNPTENKLIKEFVKEVNFLLHLKNGLKIFMSFNRCKNIELIFS